MDNDQTSPAPPHSGMYELWAIVTYAYGDYQETISVLQGDSIQEPHYFHYAWHGEDMADCAKRWCETALHAQRIGHLGPYTDEEKAQLSQIDRDKQSMWNSFKTEFRLLACTNDNKYKELRTQIAKMTGQKSQLAITSAIASGLALHMGVTVSTVLTPLCAVCYLAVAKIGRELLCNRLKRPGFEKIGVELGFEPPRPVR